jgi:hypothetical protein
MLPPSVYLSRLPHPPPEWRGSGVAWLRGVQRARARSSHARPLNGTESCSQCSVFPVPMCLLHHETQRAVHAEESSSSKSLGGQSAVQSQAGCGCILQYGCLQACITKSLAGIELSGRGLIGPNPLPLGLFRPAYCLLGASTPGLPRPDNNRQGLAPPLRRLLAVWS